MAISGLTRRNFVKKTVSAIAVAALPAIPGMALAQTGNRIRLEWQQFKLTSQYPSFIAAIASMRANTDANDRNSWLYWINVHLNYCPHSVPYFIAWHRGYIFYFERQLRLISGNNTLNLPYWDYYKFPNIPSEFTDPATGNPLYVSRLNTNVFKALDLSPFVPGVFNFQRGTPNAFETKLEAAPHNPVHDIIGNVMTTMKSPTDPIFYLHHCNVDRLTHAWALPDGKGIPYTAYVNSPATSSPYWAGVHTYAPDLSMPRSMTYDPAYLGYDFANDIPPSALPPAAAVEHGGFILAQAQSEASLRPPQERNFEAASARDIAPGQRSAGGVKNIDLDENSVGIGIPVAPAEIRHLQESVDRVRNTKSFKDAPAGVTQSVKLVFDNIVVSEKGQQGGYFYNIYLNLPPTGDSIEIRRRYFLGTISAFTVAGATHHGPAKLEFPASEILANMDLASLKRVTVSLVRVAGDNSPKGNVIRVGEIRIETSTDAPFDINPPTPRPAGSCYGSC